MTDQELDRRLAHAVNVEPSPDFLVRVRATLAAEHPRASQPGWRRAALAGVTAIAVMAVLVSSPEPPVDRADATRSDETPRAIRGSVVPAAVTSAPRLTGSRPDRSRNVAAPRTAPRYLRRGPEALEVLVSPVEAAGVRALRAAIREGRIDATILPEQVTAHHGTEIRIEPVVVEPVGPLELAALP